MTAFVHDLHLLRPWALLLLVPGFLLWWLDRRAADTTRHWARVIDPELLKSLVVGAAGKSRLRPHDMLLVGWIVAALAVAGPAWQREKSPFAEQAAPAMLVLKVAPSMMTPDLAPTRLDRARQKIADLLRQRDGTPVGLIAYGGSAHLVLPPTPDREVVVGMAGALSPAIMPREGDRLADAVKLAADVLRNGEPGGAGGGSIVVIADTVAPGQTAALKEAALAARGMPVAVFAMAPPHAVDADAALASAVETLDARQIETTIDNADVAAIARLLATAPGAPVVPGEAVRWEEAGYWLTPFIALVALIWFRRGWVIAT